jgi:serine/threonine-protein kinase HipA
VALANAEYFGLQASDAHAMAGEVGESVSGWRVVAAHLGLAGAEVDRMSSAFEHEDLQQALRIAA